MPKANIATEDHPLYLGAAKVIVMSIHGTISEQEFRQSFVDWKTGGDQAKQFIQKADAYAANLVEGYRVGLNQYLLSVTVVVVEGGDIGTYHVRSQWSQ